MGSPRTTITAAPAASANGYKASGPMANGAYTLGATSPTFGARHFTCTRTVVDVADTPGTLAVVGVGPSGEVVTETITPGANGVLVTGTQWFASITTVTGVGWTQGGTGADTIVFGWDAQNCIATGSGTLWAVVVNTTAAGAITITDAGGVVATLKASIAEGHYLYGPHGVSWAGFLRVEPAAASNITVLHSGSTPASMSM
jgi:hypothetical protein